MMILKIDGVDVSVKFKPVFTKKTKYCEPGATEYEYTIGTKNGVKFIAIRRNLGNGKYSEPKLFFVGDCCVYDSYNLIYTAKITSIGAKTVTVAPEYESRKTRMDLYTFAWRNWDYDSSRIADENHDTMMYI